METVGGRRRQRFFIPVARNCGEFSLIATASEGKIFPGHQTRWSAEQLELWRIWDIYRSLAKLPREEQPIEPILEDWGRLQFWLDKYTPGKGRTTERKGPRIQGPHGQISYVVEEVTEY